MKNATIIYILLFTVTSVAAAEKTIYKYTDEHGVTHYSEKKLNDNYKEADLPELSVVESVPPSPDANTQSSANVEPMAAGSDTDISLIKPQPKENLWGTGGDLDVTVTPLSEMQKQKYQIQFALNSEKTPPGDEASHTFKLVPRGTHQVQAFLVTRGQHAVVGKTDKITVYMHQASKK